MTYIKYENKGDLSGRYPVYYRPVHALPFIHILYLNLQWRPGIEVSVTQRLGVFKPITRYADSRTKYRLYPRSLWKKPKDNVFLVNFGIDFFSNCNPTKRSAHYFSIIIYWLEIPFWCTSRKAAFEWFIPDLVASMHKIFVIEMDMVKRLGSKGAGVASQYKPCCLQLFFLKQKYFYCLCAMFMDHH